MAAAVLKVPLVSSSLFLLAGPLSIILGGAMIAASVYELQGDSLRAASSVGAQYARGLISSKRPPCLGDSPRRPLPVDDKTVWARSRAEGKVNESEPPNISHQFPVPSHPVPSHPSAHNSL